MSHPTNLQGPRPNLPQRSSSAQSRRTPPSQFETLRSGHQRRSTDQVAARAQPQHLQRSPQQPVFAQRHRPPIQAPRHQFPSRRPLRHQLQAQIQARAQGHAQSQSHTRTLQHPLRNVRHESPSNEIPQSQVVVRQQPQSHLQIVGPFKTLLDNAFRVSAERIQSELKNWRAICTRAVCKEQQEKELLRKYCKAFKQERDVARERVRELIGKRETEAKVAIAGVNGSRNDNPSRGVKRGRDEAESSDEELGPSTSVQGIPTPPLLSPLSFPSSTMTPASAPHQILRPHEGQDLLTLPYISLSNSSTPSPTLPPVTIPHSFVPRRRTASAQPPQRSRSADPVLASASTLDMTTFDVTVLNPTRDRMPNEHPAKRRRTSGSSESSASSDRTLVMEFVVGESCFNALGLGEADMELESDVDADVVENRKSDDTAENSKLPRLSSSSSTTEVVHSQIEVVHVDIMYVPMNGKLVCRACMIRNNQKPTTQTPAPKSFPTNASWETLKQHCVEEHPEACADVAKLGPGQVYELRRRLLLG